MQTKKNRKELKRPKNSFFLILAFVLIIGFFAITIVSKQLDTRERKQELVQKQQALEQQQHENDYKKSVLANDDKSAVLEQAAREQGYVYQNEKVFYDTTPGK